MSTMPMTPSEREHQKRQAAEVAEDKLECGCDREVALYTDVALSTVCQRHNPEGAVTNLLKDNLEQTIENWEEFGEEAEHEYYTKSSIEEHPTTPEPNYHLPQAVPTNVEYVQGENHLYVTYSDGKRYLVEVSEQPS